MKPLKPTHQITPPPSSELQPPPEEHLNSDPQSPTSLSHLPIEFQYEEPEIPKDENCHIRVTNLPPRCGYHQLLNSLHGTGKVELVRITYHPHAAPHHVSRAGPPEVVHSWGIMRYLDSHLVQCDLEDVQEAVVQHNNIDDDDGNDNDDDDGKG
ncbi:hypothetical protein M426DRAFT_16586 [Hypoxylon sp. CI-4A]|nr:hypothetical protein M426DRAFT_16586 [Hypoxylon sp. CI-4A]